MDEGYIEALSEELYKKLFESGHYGKAVLKKPDASVSAEQCSATAPYSTEPQDSAQETEAGAYHAEPQDTAEAVPTEHEAEAADSAETLSAAVTATEDAAAASAETEAAACDEASVEHP